MFFYVNKILLGFLYDQVYISQSPEVYPENVFFFQQMGFLTNSLLQSFQIQRLKTDLILAKFPENMFWGQNIHTGYIENVESRLLFCTKPLKISFNVLQTNGFNGLNSICVEDRSNNSCSVNKLPIKILISGFIDCTLYRF